MAAKEIARIAESPAGLGIVIIVGLTVLYYIGKSFLSGAKDAAGAVANGVGGVLSGNNSITENQVDSQGNKVDAYQGAGILGTLGAATNTLSGGSLATIGESLGGWLYDEFNSAPGLPANAATSEPSNAIQSGSNRPYQNGNNSAYATAADNSPTDPTYAANPLTVDPNFGVADPSSWD